MDYPLIGTYALLAALASALLVLPLARRIPLRTMELWHASVRQDAEAAQQPFDPRRFDLPWMQKLAVVVGGTLLGLFVTWNRPANLDTAALVFFALTLWLLATIDLKHELLPDVVTIPVLWVGLLYHAWRGHGADPVFGAALGYMGPFLLMLLVSTLTRRHLMAEGDFKAFAMVGAWLGADAMPTVFVFFVAMLVPFSIGYACFRNGRVIPTGPVHLLAPLAYVAGVRLGPL